MRKARNSKLALLLVLTMLATLFVAIPSASAAGTYTAVTKIVKFDPSGTGADKVTGAKVQIKLDPAVSETTSKAFFEVLDSAGNKLDIKDVVYACSESVYDAYKVSAKKGYVEFTVDSNNNDTAWLNLTVTFDGSDAAAGDVKLNFFGTGGQLESGSVVIAKAVSGAVELAVVGDPAKITEDGRDSVTIRVTQLVGGSIATDSVIKIKLPKGFKWSGTPTEDGTKVKASVDTDDERILKIVYDSTESGSMSAIFDVTASVEVADTDEANKGDVVATVDGVNCTVNTSELTVATYTDYGVTVKVDSVKELVAGKASDQKTAKITVKETIANSLIEGRKVTVELPEWVKIVDVSDKSGFKSGEPTWDKNKLYFYPKENTTTKDEYTFKLELSIEAGKSGDIEAVFSGAGMAETKAVIAKAVPAISATANAVDVKIGVQAQPAADLVITENKAGALKSGTNRQIGIVLPEGVKFAGTPKVTVTGDLGIKEDQVKVSDQVYLDSGAKVYGADRVLVIPIKSESLKASTITISNIKLTVDRTVAEGSVTAKIQGYAIVDNYGSGDGQFLTATAAQAVIANVITPAPGVTTGSAVFTIGSASYTQNGETVSMPVAPYIKNGRTYLPLRFCGNAIGISDTNIWWDSATKTATLKKDNTIVQVKIGSQALYVNGVQVSTMDVAPEIKDGYTMLPIRPVMEALGATLTYDDATKTVSIEY